MNKTEYILSCVAEECSEIIKACEKAKRFGLHDFDCNSENETTNLECIIGEFNDLMGAYVKMVRMGIVKEGALDTKIINQKVTKIEHFMNYSKALGHLK